METLFKLPPDALLFGLAFGLSLAIFLIYRSIDYLFSRSSNRKQSIKFQRMRSSSADSSSGSIKIRKTDIKSNLSSSEKRLLAKADFLSEQGRIEEAVSLYVRVNFQRKAIDLLESNNMVDKAAKILIDMHLPVRAGAICARNRHPLKAAEFFKQGDRFDLAAEQFAIAARQNTDVYLQAGDCYAKAGNIESALRMFHRVLSSENIFRVCRESKNYELLAFYAGLPCYAGDFLYRLKNEELNAMVAHLEKIPESAYKFAYWLGVRPDKTMLSLAMRWTAGNEELAKTFWQRISPRDIKTLFVLMKEGFPVLPIEIYASHCRAIQQSVHANGPLFQCLMSVMESSQYDAGLLSSLRNSPQTA